MATKAPMIFTPERQIPYWRSYVDNLRKQREALDRKITDGEAVLMHWEAKDAGGAQTAAARQIAAAANAEVERRERIRAEAVREATAALEAANIEAERQEQIRAAAPQQEKK